MNLSKPVTTIILFVVVLILYLVGNRFMNPPQELGPNAKALNDAMLRARSSQK